MIDVEFNATREILFSQSVSWTGDQQIMIEIVHGVGMS